VRKQKQEGIEEKDGAEDSKGGKEEGGNEEGSNEEEASKSTAESAKERVEEEGGGMGLGRRCSGRRGWYRGI
jgi:hypothetical protein